MVLTVPTQSVPTSRIEHRNGEHMGRLDMRNGAA
jgi:hypothetical protein